MRTVGPHYGYTKWDGVAVHGAGGLVPVRRAVESVASGRALGQGIDARGFRRLVDRRLGAVLVAPLGLLGYLGWVAYEIGSVDGYFDVTRGWGNSFDCGLTFAARVAVGGLSAVGYCDGVGCRGGRVRRLRGNLVARPRPDVKCC